MQRTIQPTLTLVFITDIIASFFCPNPFRDLPKFAAGVPGTAHFVASIMPAPALAHLLSLSRTSCPLS
jgi:hypothetical protein